MAEAAVGFVVQKLGELIVQEAVSLHGAREQVEWLERELRRMQCFLKDADSKKNKGDDERIKNWVRDMRDVAFGAEDIIDTFMYLKLRRQQKQPGCIGFIKRYVFILDQLIGRHEVHVDVEEIKAKMLELSESRILYGIANIGETTGTTCHSPSQDVIPILPQLNDDIDIVGFDDEKKMMIQKVVDKSNANRLVISIVGMGGLGKTTLAKSVYNDPEVKRGFVVFAWVIISQEYTIFEIVKKILLAVSGISLEGTIEILSVNLYEKLKEQKYLVVLDDVWEENIWNELQKVFPDVNNGSRVIITTRSLNVINIADPTTQLYELRCLNENEAQELFLRKVFPRQAIEACCPIYLVDYAHQLVQRCRGLPLALVVLGGLVSTKPQTQDAWQKVVASMKWQFVEGGERCLEILALSYNNLPYYLKSCFLYFGCFQEDIYIPAQTLIRLWSAEGFLPRKNGKTTEEIGLDCLEELARRCLIQVTDRQYDGSAKYCRIHDVLRDMCIKEAKENKYLEIYKSDNADCATMPNKARRLIVTCNEIEILDYPNSNLRGLFFHGYSYDSLTFKALNRQLGGFKLLREVPSWIGHLRNLQTFIVTSGNLKKISSSLWKINCLRHVHVNYDIGRTHWHDDINYGYCSILPNMGDNQLKNLQTLKGVCAGEWIGKVLPKLTNLSKLKIYDIFDDHANALSSSLQKLGRLTSLHIHGYQIPLDIVIIAFSNQHYLKKLSLYGNLNCKQLPHNHVFPQQLVKLVLKFTELEQDPMATLEKLQFLKYLELSTELYRGKKMICSSTGFPQLLTLHIGGFDELEEWNIEEKAMQCLKNLYLWNCPNLKMIPEGLKNVPLNQLVFVEIPEELMKRIKEKSGEDWYKIQHVPNISF
ncbi:disease resistance RPP8-like protein 3 [Dioscorea cayenensis subsp. rotundata]|uniref:Disease resistance RPP8-like protein 3 n=1 Tax=Dioscorea cayennensis subsp. rotundata TaxID=55577 RepID=A0AB40AM64_DIOCR|nr:disease resistance RPP8-like protein 3 [Dioscorea cayenensis subsp. rotundata]